MSRDELRHPRRLPWTCQPTGRSVDQGQVRLYLCYSESDPDGQSGATEAGNEDGAPPDRIVEGYRIVIRDALT